MISDRWQKLRSAAPVKALPHELACSQCMKLATFRRLRALAEPELRLVPRLLRPGGVAVDVGSHSGAYAYEMARGGRAQTIAFEPNPDLHPCPEAARARPYLLLPFALSDHCGSAVMRVPVTGGIRRFGRSSISGRNRFCTASLHRELPVLTRTLDSFGLPEVGFVKIDVEGHELAVLRGAEAVIERDRPNFLIEAERRHNPSSPWAVFRFFRRRGYAGFLLSFGKLRPLRAFRRSRGAVRAAPIWRGPAFNNFVFLPESGGSR